MTHNQKKTKPLIVNLAEHLVCSNAITWYYYWKISSFKNCCRNFCWCQHFSEKSCGHVLIW